MLSLSLSRSLYLFFFLSLSLALYLHLPLLLVSVAHTMFLSLTLAQRSNAMGTCNGIHHRITSSRHESVDSVRNDNVGTSLLSLSMAKDQLSNAGLSMRLLSHSSHACCWRVREKVSDAKVSGRTTTETLTHLQMASKQERSLLLLQVMLPCNLSFSCRCAFTCQITCSILRARCLCSNLTLSVIDCHGMCTTFHPCC